MTDWGRLVRPSLIGVAPYDPGASLEELKRRYGLDEIAKLNWNEGLLGPFPGVREAVGAELENAWKYPSRRTATFARRSPPGSARARRASCRDTASRR